VVYSALLAVVVRRFHLAAWLEAALAWGVWLVVAFSLWAQLLRA
jgi:hypothetical protein